MNAQKIPKKVIKTVIEFSDVLLLSTDSTTILEAVQKLDNPSDREWVLNEFKCDLNVIKFLVEDGTVPNEID